VGYVDEPNGSILVAAGSQASHWALNLAADVRCRVTIGERSFEGLAQPLEGADHARVIRELILKYGTPAERLGLGPAFRITPVSSTGASTAAEG
jgi:hypothetical protein